MILKQYVETETNHFTELKKLSSIPYFIGSLIFTQRKTITNPPSRKKTTFEKRKTMNIKTNG